MHPWTKHYREVYCSAEDEEKWFALEKELVSEKEELKSHYSFCSTLRHKLEYVGWLQLLEKYSTNKNI